MGRSACAEGGLSARTRTASCACGELSVTCAGEPDLIAMCHCTACQRRTGSAFGVAAFFPREAVQAAGAHNTFTRQGESGADVIFHFCPTCGASVFWEPMRKPGAIAVAVGAFADPGFPAPAKEAHLEAAHPWVRALR